MRLSTIAEGKAYPAAELNGEILRRRAKKLHESGAHAEALRLLQESVKQAPKSYWALYDLAALELEMGDLSAARETAQGMLAIDSKEPAGRVLRARISAEAGRPSAALQVLEGMPAEAADGDVGKLRKALELRRDVDQVVRRSARLGVFGAQREMLRLQRRTDGDPELVGIVALGWADIGVAGRGIELIRDLQTSQAQLDPGLSLLLAAIYLRAGMDDELKQLLEELASEPSLSPRARHDLARLHVAYAVATADRLATHGEYTRALMLLEPLITEYPYDPALMSGLGRLLLQEGKPNAASSAFEQVLRQYPDHIEAREGAVAAAQAAYELKKAGELVEQGLARSPNHPRMHLISAHYALALDDDATAMRELERARELAIKGEPPDHAGEEGDAQLVPSDAAGLLVRARTQVGGGEALQAAESKALVDTIDGEIDRIRARHSVQVRSQPELRYRHGEQGLGQLIESRTPLWLSMPLGYFGRVEIGATAVWLTAGRAKLDDPGVASRFGSLGAVPGVTAPRMQDDVGISPELALLYKDVLRLQFGSTPLGFIYRDLVGSLQVRPRWGALTLTLQVDRSPVMDSVLSYAGTTDPVTGRTWGGVIQQGGFAELALGNEDLSGFLNGGFYLINGRGMEKNRLGRAMTGFAWTLYNWDGHKVSWGATLLGMKYAKNQSGFTLGHGGYFSPELFARGGTPLTWSYFSEHWRTRLEVDPGLNWFRQGDALYYPNDPDLQANLDALGGVTSYPERSNFGFSMNIGGDARWQIGNHFELGLDASMHFADDYEEYRAALVLQLNLQRRVQADPTKQ
jgi:tetratricopeptide (TPR) repeat protein